MRKITINGEEWNIVFPLGIHYAGAWQAKVYYGMLLGRRMPGTDFGLQFKVLSVFCWDNKPLLT